MQLSWVTRLALSLLLASLAAAPAAHAQSYPSKPIRIVVGAGAGGPTDLAVRVVATKVGPCGVFHSHPHVQITSVESGVFEVSVGSSSRELALTAEVQIEGDEPVLEPIHRNSLIGDLMQPGRLSPEKKALLDDFLQGGLFTPPAEDEAPAGTDGEEDDEQGNAGMMEAVGRYLPLRAAVGFAAKPDGERKLGELLEKLNG